MICATYDASGVVSVVNPPPADLMGCALLIPTASDQGNNPFLLSAVDGMAIAWAVVAVWVVGFSGRVLIRALHLGDSHVEED